VVFHIEQESTVCRNSLTLVRLIRVLPAGPGYIH